MNSTHIVDEKFDKKDDVLFGIVDKIFIDS